MANAKEQVQANEAQEPVLQPNRYVENEDFVPNPTDQYGQVLTHGPGVDATEGMGYASPLFRQHTASASGKEPTDDEYYLTSAQRAAAVSEEDEAEVEVEPVQEAPAKSPAAAKSEAEQKQVPAQQ
jgi:hypothetical protein